jgi:hypothetical protein
MTSFFNLNIIWKEDDHKQKQVHNKLFHSNIIYVLFAQIKGCKKILKILNTILFEILKNNQYYCLAWPKLVTKNSSQK